MKKRRGAGTCLVAVAAIGLAACGGDSGAGEDRVGADERRAVPAADASPTGDAAELAREIGPVREVELAPVRADLAATGEKVFTSKCSACHKLDERYVGPPLGDVTERRSPVFVMNMMLNPEGMVRDHPEVKALLAQYYTPMPNQSLTRDEARAVLEYLRAAAASDHAEDRDEDDADASEEQE
jgi:mono/diheme cytochrome c family protein